MNPAARSYADGKLTVAHHELFIKSLLTEKDHDDLDELAGDPLIERHANRRKNSQANSVLGILDQLQAERSRR